MTSVSPTVLKIIAGNTLQIDWSDDQRRHYSICELRERCPCAMCRTNRSAPERRPAVLPVLSPAEARPLRIEAMSPVGTYAYSIVFSDGHRTGIYTFELLRRLGAEATVEAGP